MQNCGIYLITCTPPGGLPRYYVGQSINIPRRLSEHRRELRSGRHYNRYLQACFAKFGVGSFLFERLESVPVADLTAAEQFWLDEMVGHGRCFNVAKFADTPSRGLAMSDEARMALSKRKTGLRHSAETKALISQLQLGKKRGPHKKETAQKIGDAQRGSKNHAFGKVGANSVRSKPVVGTHKSSGVVVRFESANMARSSGFTPSGITAACNGALRSYKGYLWSFMPRKESS